MESTENRYSLALKQITKTVNSALPSKKVITSIAGSTAKALQATGCAVMILNPQKEHLDLLGAHGLSDMYLRKGALNARKSYPEILDGKIVAVADILTDKRSQYPEHAASEKITAFMGAPIMQKEEIIGQIRIYNREKRHFKPIEKDFLSTVANMIALYLEKMELNQYLSSYHETNLLQHQKLTSFSRLPLIPIRPTNFSHPSEEEFARLLDFYQVEWLYEPRSFPLAWEDKRITEMFTPDFYLPEINLYLELTTTKQSLMTEKNRKLRRVKELYPDVNVRLINKVDYLKLFAKYGFIPLGENKIAGVQKILFSRNQIQRRVKSLAKQISRDYQGKDLVLIGILKGVLCFMSDLMQNISIPVTVDFMAISSPTGNNDSAIQITKDLDLDIMHKDILMVEDIVDTGMTLNYILNFLAARNPASLKVCTLLDKSARRLINVPLDYVGYEIPDQFVVGYGLDFRGKYRNLPVIAVLE
ncbi:MAG: hypoxanthine phosphoribosyltransferase [Dehalococcoidia bacterium]|nr:hypoxanthine phosphoribosyltransferase [Dehalococcoidia bacterium]MDD5495177.1 hypoxanthine phosphoribosyltransferase [Dehalococcoidia bacterium]